MPYTVHLPVILAVYLKLAYYIWVLALMFHLNGGSMGIFKLLSVSLF